jgi:uncharacterized protein (DUF305 family)
MNDVRRLAALLFATVALVAACGSDDDGQAADSGGDETADFNEADVAFAQNMIPHHQQAVEMAALAEDRAESDAVKDLATRIEAAQDPEIQTLQGWLEEWGEPVEADDSMGGMDHGEMSGMMSDEDMTMLEDAEGPAFDEQFLELMAAHHRGAIEMAETELDEGQFPDALAMAEEIIATQTAEIEEIEELLAA